jgi:hypothetical protein
LSSKIQSGQPVIAMDGPRLVPRMVPISTDAQRPYAPGTNSATPNAYYPMTSNMTSIILHEDEENVKRFEQDLPRLVPAPPDQTWVHPMFEGISFMMMMLLRYSSHTHTHTQHTSTRMLLTRGFRRRKCTDRESLREKYLCTRAHSVQASGLRPLGTDDFHSRHRRPNSV